MKHLGKHLTALAAIFLILTSCSQNNSNYPEEYVGFDKVKVEFTFDTSKTSEEFTVKVIAAEKKNEDRKVHITGTVVPGEEAVYSIEDKKLIIPAKKKSANVRIKIFPKMIKKPKEFRLVCNPKDKAAKKTQMTIRLIPR